MDEYIKTLLGGVGARAAETSGERLAKSGLSEEAQDVVAEGMKMLAQVARGVANRLPAAEEHAGMNLWYELVINTVSTVRDEINAAVSDRKA